MSGEMWPGRVGGRQKVIRRLISPPPAGPRRAQGEKGDKKGATKFNRLKGLV